MKMQKLIQNVTQCLAIWKIVGISEASLFAVEECPRKPMLWGKSSTNIRQTRFILTLSITFQHQPAATYSLAAALMTMLFSQKI